MTVEERDIDLVLVTGAGASREFGNNQGSAGPGLLPLMGDWSDSVLRKVGNIPGGREFVGLDPALQGIEFERRLGRFLRLAQMFPDIEAILDASIQQPIPGISGPQPLRNWHRQTTSYLEQCLAAIHGSLYESFGWERTLPQAAVQPYRNLFQALRVAPPQSLVYTTTNYDRIGEAVLDRLGWRIDCGERTTFSGPGTGGQQTIDVDRLTDGLSRYTPVLHLHGAVGWYRRQTDGSLLVAGGTMYQADFGVPIVMLPDPEKDYEAEPIIQTLWSQFGEALQRAKRVLVLGHSLSDPGLVEALRTHVEPGERLAVTLLATRSNSDELDPSAASTLAIIRERLPAARLISLRFDRNMAAPTLAINNWYEQLDYLTSGP